MIRRSLCAAAACCLLGSAALAEPRPNDWVLNEQDMEERFSLIQGQFGGFGKAMLEIGQRYKSMQRALKDENYELARYQLEEMEEVLEDGMLRRPGRAANSERFFPESLWKQTDEAFASADKARASAAFSAIRGACIGCHVAEDVAFMNDQPMFRDKTAGGKRHRDRD